MGALGEWGRGVARAGSVALLLPLALALGVGLSGALGGRDRLRALGQVLHGPATPEATRSGSPDLTAAVRVPPLRVRPVTTAPARRGAGGRRTTGTAPGGGPRTPTSRGPGGSGGGTTTPATPTSPSGGGGGGGGGGGSSPSPPATPPQPNLVRETGEQVVGVAQQLPAPVGPVAADTVQTVVDLVAPPRP